MRFKLKTEYMQFVRDQIRGGLWFAPSWWNAVSKVPPVHFQPIVPKRKVPKITFPEDKLKREFNTRNPVIAAFDKGRPGQPSSTVAASFVDRQLEAMKESKSKQEAYDVAMAWMLENGKSMLDRLDIPAGAKATLYMRPEDLPRARHEAQAYLQSELVKVRELLATAAVGGETAVGESQMDEAIGRYRSFYNEREQIAFSMRGVSKEPMPDTSVDEDELVGGAEGGTGAGAAAAASPGVLSSQAAEEAVAARVLSGSSAPSSAVSVTEAKVVKSDSAEEGAAGGKAPQPKKGKSKAPS